MNEFRDMPGIEEALGAKRWKMQQLQNTIAEKLSEMYTGIDTLVSFVKATTWGSSIDLAEAWIEQVAPGEYKQLNTAEEDMEAENLRIHYRWIILKRTSDLIDAFLENMGILDKIQWTIPVAERNLGDLPSNDQDRIITKSFMVSYRAWQSILGILAIHPEALTLFENPVSKMGYALHTGRHIPTFRMHSEDESLISRLQDDIPGIEIHTGTSIVHFKKGSEIVETEVPISIFLLSDTILERYTYAINNQNGLSMAREAAIEKLGNPSVWKRRFSGGNNKSKKENYLTLPVGARG